MYGHHTQVIAASVTVLGIHLEVHYSLRPTINKRFRFQTNNGVQNFKTTGHSNVSLATSELDNGEVVYIASKNRNQMYRRQIGSDVQKKSDIPYQQVLYKVARYMATATGAVGCRLHHQ